MNQPEASRLLRSTQIEFQYLLNKYLNDTGQTPEEVAESAGVSVLVVNQLAKGTYAGLLPYLFAVALAIGKAPVLELKPLLGAG